MKHPPSPACRPAAPGLAALLLVAAGLLLSGGLGRAQNTTTLSPPAPFQTAPDISSHGTGDTGYTPPSRKRSEHAIRHGYRNVTDNAIRHGYDTPTDHAIRRGYKNVTDNAVRHGYQNVTDHAIRHGYE